MPEILIATDFSGIGSPEQAMTNLGVPFKSVFACDKDKYARASFNAIHHTEIMYDDITTRNQQDAPKSDLYIFGFPCQAFSIAGERKGFDDIRGTLVYNSAEYIREKKPKVFIAENVKGLLSHDKAKGSKSKFGRTFSTIIKLLGKTVNGQIQMDLYEDSLDYNLHYTVLNTKNYGLPQNRERVFIVGIRNDLPNDFRFPIGWKLDKRLKDVLETNVDEKYYLSEKLLKWIGEHREKRGSSGKHVFDGSESHIGCITARYHKTGAEDSYIQVKEATKQGFAIAEPICVAMRGRNPDNPSDRTTGAKLQQTLEPNSQGITNTLTSVQKDNLIIELNKVYQLPGSHEATGRVYDAKGLCPTITAKQGGGHEPKTNIGSRIRRLLPIECWRLQGFPDESFYKAKAVNSDTQLYKQAGNSISVPVIQAVIKNILPILLK